MLQLRVYGDSPALAPVADKLEEVRGVRHVSLTGGRSGGASLLTADLSSDAADDVIATLHGLGVAADDLALVRLETVGPAVDEPLALVWADVLAQAHARARAPIRYFVLMGVAGVIAGVGVIKLSAILIVGAMAISPDLLPVTAACTGIVLRRWRLVLRGLGALIAGLVATCILAVAVTALLDALGALPDGFTVAQVPAAQTHVSWATIFVALAAGMAGMLAVETRANASVGVAISVTTIPASAYLGVALAVGQLDKSWSALGVLAVNISMMVVGGSLVLGIQRAATSARRVASA
jgi:uncharacterized hydrophobic protein (TIGR00271 family)